MTGRPPIPAVPDHAVLRYLERKHGVDIEAIRQHIRALVTRGVDKKGDAVVIEGVKFVLRGNVVVTVLDRRWPAQKHREEDRDA